MFDDYSVLTVGVDFASQSKNTAVCAVQWSSRGVVVQECRLNVTDGDIETIAGLADKVGIDVPFGWPQAFVAAVAGHHQRQPWPKVTSLELRFRRTDLYIQDATLKWPLSVSSDRIACTAFRAAALLSQMERRYGLIDRTGSGLFVEVYPRAARDRWEIASLDSLRAATHDWLELPEDVAISCRTSEHCFDALIAALVTRAAAVSLCDAVPEADVEVAAVEGWIALPCEGTLRRLPSADHPRAED